MPHRSGARGARLELDHVELERSTRRGGFTFIEVMFAVLILGFGVIMIASMLPVAIRETQRTRETSAGSAVVESGYHALEVLWNTDCLTPGSGIDQTATGPTAGLPTNGVGVTVTYPDKSIPWVPNPGSTTTLPRLLHRTLGSRIDSQSPQAAWIPFYTRSGMLPPQVALVGVRSRNVDALPSWFFNNPDSCPLPVEITMVEGSQVVGGKVEAIEPDLIEFNPGAYTFSNYEEQVRQALCEGAVVVTVNGNGDLRIYRLSQLWNDASNTDELIWELAPGGDFAASVDAGGTLRSEAHNAAGGNLVQQAYIVGRMLQDPGVPWDEADNPYVGPSQVAQVLDGRPLR